MPTKLATLAALLLLGASMTVAALAALGQNSLVGRAAPAVNAPAVDLTRFELNEALKKGPVYLYFISTTCPVANEATKYYDRISKAFKPGAVTVVGIVSDDKRGFLEWNKAHKLAFPIVCDPDYEVIDAYKITNSPSAVLIAPDGKVSKAWTGYSEGFLRESVGVISSYLKVDPPKVDFAGAPKIVELGCAI